MFRACDSILGPLTQFENDRRWEFEASLPSTRQVGAGALKEFLFSDMVSSGTRAETGVRQRLQVEGFGGLSCEDLRAVQAGTGMELKRNICGVMTSQV